MMMCHNAADFPQGRAWIELDRSALLHNVRALRALLPKGCELMPAVKANAYGHGAALVAGELQRAGIGSFCVASAAEAVELRKAGITGEILILGYTHPRQFSLLRHFHLTQTVLDHDYAELLNRSGRKIDVHIKIDTGMHRLGERCEHTDHLKKIFSCENLRITGAYTHLCTSDKSSPREEAFVSVQTQAFYEAIAKLREQGCVCPKVHVLASYGLVNYPEIGGDYARIGIALYGMLSTREDTEECARKTGLRPVLSLKARIISVKDVFAEESAGYGLQFTAQRDGKIAVAAVGYADGLPRSLSCGAGEVLIRGKRAPVVGRVCMDQTLIDVTEIPDAEAGDIAVFIGKSGEEEITACDLAEEADTISNEILSRLGARLKRIMI